MILSATEPGCAKARDLKLLHLAYPEDVRIPPLGWEELRAWESRWGVLLPEPYRTFVAEISNGTYGGPPGDETEGLPSFSEFPPDLTPSLPFPLTKRWMSRVNWQDLREYDEDAELYQRIQTHGVIPLGCDGLAEWFLVLNGPQRGRIWVTPDEPMSAYPYRGPSDDEDTYTFIDWVRQWHEHQSFVSREAPISSAQ